MEPWPCRETRCHAGSGHQSVSRRAAGSAQQAGAHAEWQPFDDWSGYRRSVLDDRPDESHANAVAANNGLAQYKHRNRAVSPCSEPDLTEESGNEMNAEEKAADASDEALARYFEERKGEVAIWEEKPLKIRVRRGGASTSFAVRLAPEELEELQAAAKKRGRTVSDFIRSAALAAARVEVEPARTVSVAEVTDLMDALRESVEAARRKFESGQAAGSKAKSPGKRSKSA